MVGINYELAEDPEPEGPIADIKPTKKRTSRRVRPALRSARTGKPVVPAQSATVTKPVAQRFTAIIKRRAELELAIDIKALDEETARERALGKIRRKRFDGARAIVRDEVMSVQEAGA